MLCSLVFEMNSEEVCVFVKGGVICFYRVRFFDVVDSWDICELIWNVKGDKGIFRDGNRYVDLDMEF